LSGGGGVVASFAIDAIGRVGAAPEELAA